MLKDFIQWSVLDSDQRIEKYSSRPQINIDWVHVSDVEDQLNDRW